MYSLGPNLAHCLIYNHSLEHGVNKIHREWVESQNSESEESNPPVTICDSEGRDSYYHVCVVATDIISPADAIPVEVLRWRWSERNNPPACAQLKQQQS